jgi:hypothetical protein
LRSRLTILRVCVFGRREFGSGLLQQVEGEFSQNYPVFLAVILAVPGAVLVEGYIQLPQFGWRGGKSLGV